MTEYERMMVEKKLIMLDNFAKSMFFLLFTLFFFQNIIAFLVWESFWFTWGLIRYRLLWKLGRLQHA